MFQPTRGVLDSSFDTDGRLTTATAPAAGVDHIYALAEQPDGRVVTMGSDPLYDRTGRNPGTFEQRIEIYSPPYLFRGERPKITSGPRVLSRKDTATYTTANARRIVAARLIRPSAS